MCLAQEYSINDKCLALSLGAELYKYRFYQNDMLTIIREEEPEQLIKGTRGKPAIKKMERQPEKAKTLEEHLKGASQEIKKLFIVVDERIREISSEVERYIRKTEVAYKTSLNFAYLVVQPKKNCIRCHLRTDKDKIKDPKKLTTKIPKTHGYGNITRSLFIYPSKINDQKYTVDDVIDIIRQSYNATQ